MKPLAQKCAIYTRKSTDKGLEQDFNTLDAQREACLAYISSQKSEGWTPVKQKYDDGGYSGGSLDRPALRQLLEDVKARKIDIIVIYKIDRLTRSLSDFAKLVEVFDQFGVSFVSITQSFNNTTPMGKLTLNILLSFSQFEREVIGERIRDKIAASKKRGMWMGGCPPLGYEIKERRLIINEGEAKDIRYIFDRYLELGSVIRLKGEVEEKGIKSKSWLSRTGREYKGQHYGYGGLHHVLSNPIYAGYIKHKGKMNEGLHEGIISKEKWQRVQEALISNACTERGHKKQTLKYLLKKKIFDTGGAVYTPMRANKGGKQYRYYVSQNRIQNRTTLRDVIARLPAHEIETLILNSMISEMQDTRKLSDMLGLNAETDCKTLEHISKRAEAVSNLHEAVYRVTVDTDRLTVNICLKKLRIIIQEGMGVGLATCTEEKIHSLNVTYHTKRARRGAVMICGGDGSDPLELPKHKLASLVKGAVWREMHFSGHAITQIAATEGITPRYVRTLIEQSMIF